MEDMSSTTSRPPDEARWTPADLYWWPRRDQDAEYLGAASYKGPFTLGFFAGISVGCSDVTLDSDGHELCMTWLFYVQQRFFIMALLRAELVNRTFAQGKGPAD